MFSSFRRYLTIQAQDLILQGVVGALTDHGIRPLPYTLRMSPDYRIYDDRWRVDASVRDEPVDVSSSFDLTRNVMDEIAQAINMRPTGRQDMDKLITAEMAQVVFGSNQIERLGTDLDETVRLCLLVFAGEEGLKNVDRHV